MLTDGRSNQPADNRQNAIGRNVAYSCSRNMFHQNHKFTYKNRVDLLSLLYVIKIDTFKICATQQLMDQYGPEARFIVLEIHGAVRLLDLCIEEVEKKLMQQFTPMEETDEGEVEIADTLDEV